MILLVPYHVTCISRLADRIEDVAILCLELSLSSCDLQIDTHMTTTLCLDRLLEHSADCGLEHANHSLCYAIGRWLMSWRVGQCNVLLPT